MGITQLNEFLRSKYPHLYKQVNLSHFSYKKVAFDASSYFYSYIAVYGKEKNRWLNGFLNLIYLFKRHHIHVCFIFDGKPPPEKSEERNNRRANRDKTDEKTFNLSLALTRYKQTGEKWPILIETSKKLFNKKYNEETRKKHKSLLRPSNDKEDEMTNDIIDIPSLEEYVNSREKNNFELTPDDMQLLQNLLTVLKIPFLGAPGEADALACYLANCGKVDAVLSLDSDCVAYGVPLIINKLDVGTGLCTIFEMNSICKSLEVNTEELRLFCILCGCDYNRFSKKIVGVGPVTALKLVKQWKTYDKLRENEKKFRTEDDGLKYEACVRLFTLEYPELIENAQFTWGHDLNMSEIMEFFGRALIYFDKSQIEQLWLRPRLIFDEHGE